MIDKSDNQNIRNSQSQYFMDPSQIISPDGSSDPVFSTEQTQQSSGKKINPRVTMTGLGQCHMEWDDQIHERPISFEIKESVNTTNNKHTVSTFDFI